MPPVIILFAKTPAPGKVKTRLIPALGAAAAATLHTALVSDQIEALRNLPAAGTLELFTDKPSLDWPWFGGARRLQHGHDLGERMLHAIEFGLAGHPKACILGSDSPDLPPNHLLHLLSLDTDVALGPADDGGYWGICCRRSDPRMFEGVGWSQPDTLEKTVAACKGAGLTVGLGRTWYDVDDVRSLRRLIASSSSNLRHVQAWIEENQEMTRQLELFR